MTRVLLLAVLLQGVLSVLTSCGKAEQSTVDVKLLSTDVYFEIAQHKLILPFAALEDFANQHQSFSLDNRRDEKSAQDGLSRLLNDSSTPEKPQTLNFLTVAARPFGWNDADRGQMAVCPLLTREWARSVCDNPWAAVVQALPRNRFELVDLRRLEFLVFDGQTNLRRSDGPNSNRRVICSANGKVPEPLPRKSGEAAMICGEPVFGGNEDKFHLAVLRIDGDLGALWTVWRHGQNGETVEEMTRREGNAIAAFTQYALGAREDFSKLQVVACGLRRPGAVDAPRGTDCGRSGSS